MRYLRNYKIDIKRSHMSLIKVKENSIKKKGGSHGMINKIYIKRNIKSQI